MTLIERISKEMDTDMDNFTMKQSELLREVYAEANVEARDLLDRAFICLCGWSLKRLIESVPTDTDSDEEDNDESEEEEES